MADPSVEEKENPSPKIISCFSLATKENDSVDTETDSLVKFVQVESSRRSSSKRGLKNPPEITVQKICRIIYGDISNLSYKRIYSATYTQRIDSYLGKILAKMSRAQLIEFGKIKVQKELNNNAEIKGLISRQAQLCKSLKAYKKETQVLQNRTRNGAVEKTSKRKTNWSKPFDTEAINNSELEVKCEVDDFKTEIELRAADSMVSLPGDPLDTTECNKNKPSNRLQASECTQCPTLFDKINIDLISDGETLSEQYCFTGLCNVVSEISTKIPEQNNMKEGKGKDICLNPRVVLTDINKLLEKRNKTSNIQRVFEKKWTVPNAQVSTKDNLFHQIQRISCLKMKLCQRYFKNSGNVYYYEKLRNPVLENVRATTKVTAPKASLTGRCGYLEYCKRLYAFKLFYGRAVIEEKSQGTGSEQTMENLERKVATCKPNFEKQWTARIPGVAPKDNCFDRIQKLQSLKLNTNERYLKIHGKLYYLEKLQNPLQERVRYSTVMSPAKETLHGRCGYLIHGRNSLYLFKLIDENLTEEHNITTVVNTPKVATRRRNSNINQTEASTYSDIDSRVNRGKVKQQDIKPAVIPCESFFDIFGTNDSEFVDIAFKNNRKRKTSDWDYGTNILVGSEELCWEIPTIGGEAVRIKAKYKSQYDWTPSRFDSSLNILGNNNINNVFLPTSLPRNANNAISQTILNRNVILPRKTLFHNVKSRKIMPPNANNNISPKSSLPYRANNVFPPVKTSNANNVVSPTKTSGTNVLKRVLILKSRKSSQIDELLDSSRKKCNNVLSLMSAAQIECRISGSVNNTTPRGFYSGGITTSLNSSLNKEVLVIPPLAEGPPCHSVVKINKTGQQCIVKRRPSALNVSSIQA